MSGGPADPADLVKLRLRLVERDDLPPGEHLWAEPVVASDGGGTFRLQNTSVLVPLVVGDLVRAELDPMGYLQVVDVVEPGPFVLTQVTTTATVTDDVRDAMTDRWQSSGATWTEGRSGLLVTAWEHLGIEEIAAVLRPDVLGGRIVWESTSLPSERTREQQRLVDFDLDPEEPGPVFETSYWAGDDPWWAEHGLDDPELLAYVQRVAGEEPRVARALERGQQDRVMLFLERINAPDPSLLPPLDGPIFDDEDDWDDDDD